MDIAILYHYRQQATFCVRRWFLTLSLCGCCILSLSASANLLTLTLNHELPSSIRKNILAHLGALPNNDDERDVFVYSAKHNVTQALQALGYYRTNIALSVDKAEVQWQMNISVRLNQPTLVKTLDIQILGDAKHDTEFTQLVELSPLKPGIILNHGDYESFKTDLLTLGQTRGYFDGQLLDSKIAIHQSYHDASIVIHYDSGHRYQFGEVNFDQQALNPSVLNALVPFSTGDYFTTEAMYQLQRQLQLSHYFSQIMAIPDKSQASNFHVPVNVTLRNKQRHHFDVGIGYATDTEYRLTAGWRTPLVNRYGHRQETRLKYSTVNPTGKFVYSIPLSHPINDLLQFQFMLADDRFADINSNFFSVKLGRIRNDSDWLRQHYLRYLHETWDVPNATIDQQHEKAEYYIPGITWALTQRDGSVLDPSGGLSQWYNIEAAEGALASALSFFRVHARWQYVKLLAPKHRMVAKAELGAIFSDSQDDSDLSPSLRFYAGGDQSIRGFGYQSIGTVREYLNADQQLAQFILGGTRLATLSLEYQYYLTQQWRLALFTDAGDAAEAGKFQFKHSLGAGIHYLSPVGAIRFNFARGVGAFEKGWRIHFTLGAEF